MKLQWDDYHCNSWASDANADLFHGSTCGDDVRGRCANEMTPTQLLTLGEDPAITKAFLAQVDQARPGKFRAYTAHSLEEFRALAEQHQADVNAVVLGAAQTDEQVKNAKSVVNEVWAGKMEVLRIPSKLLTPEGKSGGMMRWFLEHIEGSIEGECGCC